MPYQRDPLSARYDAAVSAELGRAYAAPSRWHYLAVPEPGPRVRAAVGADTDTGGLRPWERAYQRSLYWNHNGGGNGRRNPVWSLQAAWGPVTARGRLLGIRVSPVDVAYRALARKPASRRYTANAALRSGGAGSPQQRFA